MTGASFLEQRLLLVHYDSSLRYAREGMVTTHERNIDFLLTSTTNICCYIVHTTNIIGENPLMTILPFHCDSQRKGICMYYAWLYKAMKTGPSLGVPSSVQQMLSAGRNMS